MVFVDDRSGDIQVGADTDCALNMGGDRISCTGSTFEK